LENDLAVLGQTSSNLKRKLSFLGLTEEQVRALEETDLGRPGSASAIVTSVPIRSPADGWIVGFNVVPGQVVRPQDNLFEIQDLSKVWAKGFVFERDASKIGVGQVARVSFSAYPDLTVTGKIVQIAPIMESSERVLPVWIEVDNPDFKLKEGMLAKVAVSSEGLSGAQTARRLDPNATLPDKINKASDSP
jgi:multidrug resistance efflux pump